MSCSICLEVPNSRGQINSCDHTFCFLCIEKWSEVTNLCPVCKKRFLSIKEIKLNLDKENEIPAVNHKLNAPLNNSTRKGRKTSLSNRKNTKKQQSVEKVVKVKNRNQKVAFEDTGMAAALDLYDEESTSQIGYDDFITFEDDGDIFWGFSDSEFTSDNNFEDDTFEFSLINDSLLNDGNFSDESNCLIENDSINCLDDSILVSPVQPSTRQAKRKRTSASLRSPEERSQNYNTRGRRVDQPVTPEVIDLIYNYGVDDNEISDYNDDDEVVIVDDSKVNKKSKINRNNRRKSLRNNSSTQIDDSVEIVDIISHVSSLIGRTDSKKKNKKRTQNPVSSIHLKTDISSENEFSDVNEVVENKSQILTRSNTRTSTRRSTLRKTK